jgi:hypothetical protein
MRHISQVIWAFVISLTAQAYTPVPGAIPLEFGHYPATDLVCDSHECGEGIKLGDVLSPDQAIEYYDRRNTETAGQWSLADLNPQETELWSNKLGGDIQGDDSKLNVSDLDQVQFISKAMARLGTIRLTVQDRNEDHYTLMFGKTIHNMLLRKALLRKLGYFVPATKYVGRIKINYPSVKELTGLIKDLKIVNAGAWERWILSIKAAPVTLQEKVDLINAADFEIPKTLDLTKAITKFTKKEIKKIDKVLAENLIGQKSNEIVMQDVIAMEDDEFYLNLSRGYLEQYVIQGQRKFDSLIIPYALTNVPESINLLNWTVGREYTGNIVLNYPIAHEFDCSRGDAYWMVKRLLKLTEADWEEIVRETKLPRSVQSILLEKLKSRRNHLAHLFKVDITEFPVNPEISSGDDLVAGKLEREFYEGYARRFSIDDPDSPFAFSDMMAMFRSKLLVTTGLEFAVQFINSSGWLGTDLGEKIQNYNNDYLENVLTDDVARSLLEGDLKATPVKSMLFPTAGGNLILNREIVSGSYMGTDNLIQLVDSIGVSAHVGLFGGLVGVDAPIGKVVPFVADDGTRKAVRNVVPINLTANARMFYNRVYSHIRPLTSIQKGLKYPYKNMMVPLLMRKYGKNFDELMNADYQAAKQSKKLEINSDTYETLGAMLETFKKTLKRAKKKFRLEVINEAIAKTKESLKGVEERFKTLTKADVDAQGNLQGVDDLIELSNIFGELNKKVNAYYQTSGCKKQSDIKEEGVVCATWFRGKKVNKKVTQLQQLAQQMTRLATLHLYKLRGVQRAAEIGEVLRLIGENIEVGESLVISDSIGGALTIGAGASLYNIAKVNVNVKPDKLLMHRLHILRKNENEIHVYKSLGNVNGIQYAVSAQKFVPIMKVTVRTRKGKARTQFFKVAIGNTDIKNGRTVVNQNRFEKLKALRKTFLNGSVRRLREWVKPIELEHKFKDNSLKVGFLVGRYNYLNLSDRINISSEEGHNKELYRQYLGNSRGLDYENYVKDLVDMIVSKASGLDYTISSFNEGNPGFTFMGRAKNKVLSYEAILGENGEMISPTVQVSNIWNGWQLKKKGALKVLERIKKHYKFTFFEEEALAQTKKLILYNISANTFVYENGLKHLLSLSDDEIKAIWTKTQTRNMTNFPGDDALKHSGIKRMLKHRVKYSEALLTKDYRKMGKHLLKMIRIIDTKLSLKGFTQLVGGSQNLFAIGRIDGFRIGDENGDREVLSSSFGRMGREGVSGPFKYIRDFLGMSNQEFALNWLLGRVL